MEGTRPLCGDHSESFTKRGGGEEEEKRKRKKEEEREWVGTDRRKHGRQQEVLRRYKEREGRMSRRDKEEVA